MRLGIDASNIRSGGGLTHLIELLRNANPSQYDFEKVIIWSSYSTLTSLDEKSWLAKCHEKALEGNYFQRALWQRNQLGTLVKKEHCDLLYVPGGSFATTFRPIVTMSQNMLPFEWKELRRFGFSTMTLRYLLLRVLQKRSLKNADGIIFLTNYSKNEVQKVIGSLEGCISEIPHGIDKRFFNTPRGKVGNVDLETQIKIIYVSIINFYKHQCNVVEAVATLRREGFYVSLDLIGQSYPPALKKMQKKMQQKDPAGDYIHYLGSIPYDELHAKYAEADICVFASSCESLPNILLEGMAAGLPIACSNYGPMPEILGDAGVYFNPESSDSIADAIRQYLISSELRSQKSKESFQKSHRYSWEKCAHETFSFFQAVIEKYR